MTSEVYKLDFKQSRRNSSCDEISFETKKITCLKVDSSPLLWSVYQHPCEYLGSVINQFLVLLLRPDKS
jgi:hypothetical protein